MRKFVKLFVVLLSLPLLAAESAKTSPAQAGNVQRPVIAEPQTMCEQGFIYIQFKGEQEWFQTARKCETASALKPGHTSPVRALIKIKSE